LKVSTEPEVDFVSLSWIRTTDKLAINKQKFAQVRLELKFAFIIRLFEFFSQLAAKFTLPGDKF